MTAPTLAAPVTPDAAVLAALETPCYLLDPTVVGADLRALRTALGTPVVVSVKASPVLDLLVRCNHDFGDGIEIASMGELNLTIGRISVPRYVNTPAMDATLVAASLACNATLVADNPHQIGLIEHAARQATTESRDPPDIVLRVHAASLLGHDRARADHFGMDLPTLHREIDRLGAQPRGPRLIGLHVFAGSLSFATSGAALVGRLGALVAQLRARPGALALDRVLVGAGLPADWQDQDLDFDRYRHALKPLLDQVQVLHEAGRAVFSRSGRFVTRVLAVKSLNGESIVVCDGGMAHCFALAQTEQFVKSWRQPDWTGATPRTAAAEGRTYTVVGNSCSRADVIGRLRADTEPRPGDWLTFEQCGAYHTYSPTGFLNLRIARRYLPS